MAAQAYSLTFQGPTGNPVTINIPPSSTPGRLPVVVEEVPFFALARPTGTTPAGVVTHHFITADDLRMYIRERSKPADQRYSFAPYAFLTLPELFRFAFTTEFMLDDDLYHHVLGIMASKKTFSDQEKSDLLAMFPSVGEGLQLDVLTALMGRLVKAAAAVNANVCSWSRDLDYLLAADGTTYSQGQLLVYQAPIEAGHQYAIGENKEIIRVERNKRRRRVAVRNMMTNLSVPVTGSADVQGKVLPGTAVFEVTDWSALATIFRQGDYRTIERNWWSGKEAISPSGKYLVETVSSRHQDGRAVHTSIRSLADGTSVATFPLLYRQQEVLRNRRFRWSGTEQYIMRIAESIQRDPAYTEQYRWLPAQNQLTILHIQTSEEAIYPLSDPTLVPILFYITDDFILYVAQDALCGKRLHNTFVMGQDDMGQDIVLSTDLQTVDDIRKYPLFPYGTNNQAQILAIGENNDILYLYREDEAWKTVVLWFDAPGVPTPEALVANMRNEEIAQLP